ncbi:MAG TPA: M23 family metallopeptidase [Candidatus Babeliales bacterium]|nr:M23 family metallopeptidase [Candidatus Babeliales bacterium]
MAFRERKLGILFVFGVTALVGWYGYGYFFDATIPNVQIEGLQNNSYYAGDIQCCVACNKRGELSIWLDNQPLLNKFSVSGGQDYPFAIPTQSIANGEHTVRAEFTEKTFAKKHATLSRQFYVDNNPLQAAFVKPDADYKVLQGRTLHVQFQVNKPIKEAKVTALSSDYTCFPEADRSPIYECYVPVLCEQAPNEYLFSVEIVDNVGNVLHLDNKMQVVMFPFKKQTLQFDKEMVQTERKLGLSIAERERMIEELGLQSEQKKLWNGSFCTPIDIVKVTCDFGTIRTTQEKGRYKHGALDVISSTQKSVIWATQAGKVVLKDRFEDSGNTVVIDHGFGVLSLFYHLENFANIEVGQKIAQGAPLGIMGKTGYAKGYHLHWEMRVNNMQVDPMQWTQSTF